MPDIFGPSEGLDLTKSVAGADIFAPDPNAPGPFKRGLKSGVADLKSIGAGVMQYAGRATGWGALEKKGEEIGQAAATESAPYRMQVEDVGKAFDQGVIPGLKSSADLLAYTIGNQIPMMATAAVGGVLGRVAAGAFGATRAMAGVSAAEKAAAVARTAEGVGTTTDAAITHATRMADLGAELGVGASSTAMELGQIAPEGLKPENNAPLTQMAIGSIISGATDTIVPVYLARKLGLIGAAERVLAPRAAGYGAIAKDIGTTALKVGGFEAGQEGLQSYIERLSANQKVTGEEANSDYLNSAVMGGIMGLISGGVAGGFHGVARPVVAPVQEQPPSTIPEQPPVVNTPEEQHAAATQQMAEFEAGVTQARAAQKVASDRLAELTAEKKLDFKERRSYPEIDAERNTVQEQARQAKETAKKLEDQWFAAKKTVDELTPQISAAVETPRLAEQTPVPLTPEQGLAAANLSPEAAIAPVPSGQSAIPTPSLQQELKLKDGSIVNANPSGGEYFDGQGNIIDRGAVSEWRNVGETAFRPIAASTPVASEPGMVDGGVPVMITNAMRQNLQERGYSADAIANMTPAQAHENIQTTASHPINVTPAQAVENIRAVRAANPELTPDQAHVLNTMNFSELAKQSLDEKMKAEAAAKVQQGYGAPVENFVNALPPTAQDQRQGRIAEAIQPDVKALVDAHVGSFTAEKQAKVLPEGRAKLADTLSSVIVPAVERGLANPSLESRAEGVKREVLSAIEKSPEAKRIILKEDRGTFANGLAEKVSNKTLHSKGAIEQPSGLVKESRVAIELPKKLKLSQNSLRDLSAVVPTMTLAEREATRRWAEAHVRESEARGEQIAAECLGRL